MAATSGSILPGGIVLMDEPVTCNVTTFEQNGEVLMTFVARPGGNCAQIIMGLSAAQALQLIERLQIHADACRRACAAGKGGVTFKQQS